MQKRVVLVCLLALTGLCMSCGDDDIICPLLLPELPDSVFINLEQWPASNGGNSHFYAVIAIELYRDQVEELINSYHVEPWIVYLATITSAGENSFILDHIVAGTGEQSVLDAFWVDARFYGGVWFWSTGEPFDYTNWALGEPSHPWVETAMTMWGPSNTASNRVPGTWNDAPPDSSTNPLAKFWAVVEFERSIYDDGSSSLKR